MKKQKPNWPKINAIALIISTIVIIVCSSFSHYLFNTNFYYKEYAKNKVYDTIPENLTKAATNNIFNYFHNREDLKFFSMEERSHLGDVKVIIGIMYVFYAFSMILFIFCISYVFKTNRGKRRIFDYSTSIREILHSTKIGSLITFCLTILIFLIGITVGFDRLFTVFHDIFFPQGNWSFPSYYPLIVMYPGQFFSDISLRIGILILATSAILFAISLGTTLALSRHKP